MAAAEDAPSRSSRRRLREEAYWCEAAWSAIEERTDVAWETKPCIQQKRAENSRSPGSRERDSSAMAVVETVEIIVLGVSSSVRSLETRKLNANVRRSRVEL